MIPASRAAAPSHSFLTAVSSTRPWGTAVGNRYELQSSDGNRRMTHVFFFRAKSVPHCMLPGRPTKGCVGITECPVLDYGMGEHNLIDLYLNLSKVSWLQNFLYFQDVNHLLSHQVKGTGNEYMKRSCFYGKHLQEVTAQMAEVV